MRLGVADVERRRVERWTSEANTELDSDDNLRSAGAPETKTDCQYMAA